jgi:hypothetical protein
VLPLITGIDVSGKKRFVLMNLLPSILDGHIGELTEAQAFLPTHIAVPMLEKLPTALTDSQLQANTFGIGVFGFTAWAAMIVGF